MDERRRYPRLNFNVEVEYHKIDASRNPDKLTGTKNISIGGVCIVALDKLNVGDAISLKIYLPDEMPPIYTKGLVAWVEEFSVGSISTSKAFDAGIEFVDLKDDDKDRINKFVIQRMT